MAPFFISSEIFIVSYLYFYTFYVFYTKCFNQIPFIPLLCSIQAPDFCSASYIHGESTIAFKVPGHTKTNITEKKDKKRIQLKKKDTSHRIYSQIKRGKSILPSIQSFKIYTLYTLALFSKDVLVKTPANIVAGLYFHKHKPMYRMAHS